MSTPRKIQKSWKSKPTIEGAGVHLKRVFGFQEVPELDPFLLLDDFHSNRPAEYLPGFPWHPHRGIETITAVLQGDVEHGDSMGNKGIISSGDVQWMTAGSGIIHQEMPKGDPEKMMWGFQLWANLPASGKMMDPRYRDVQNDQIPVVKDPTGAVIRIVSGAVNGVSGPVRGIVIDPEFLDISLPAGITFSHPVKRGHTLFSYIIEGNGYFDESRDSYGHERVGSRYFDLERNCLIGPETLVLYDRDGDHITVTTTDGSVRFLLVSGKPIGEPVAWYGPIVMNTQEELRTAFEEYKKGTFIKHK
jgi:quercetin 2,3-dioxygenase